MGNEVIYLQHAQNPERNGFVQNRLKAPLKTWLLNRWQLHLMLVKWRRRRRRTQRERIVRISQAVSSERHALLNKPVLSSWRMYSRSDKWYATLFHLFEPDWNLAMPRLVPTLSVPENGDPPWVYARSTDTRHFTRIPIKIHSVDMGYPLAVDSLLDSGATGMFTNVEYVRTQKLQTHPLPCAIPVYNIDGTPNEAGSIKEEVDLICIFGNHSECATFLVTSLGSMGIILGSGVGTRGPELIWCYNCNTEKWWEFLNSLNQIIVWIFSEYFNVLRILRL